MIRRGIGLGGRLAAVGFAMALVLSLAGDFGRAATVPAVINGQDPLEVLSLKIRPNVIIVFDSSGSMTSRLPGGDTGSGDHPRSRMYQGKEVLRQVIAANQDKASFMFGNYTQVNSRLRNRNEGDDRFQYYTSSDLSPIMLTNEITIERARDDTNDRGFQSWQWIDAQWNTLYFDEDAATDAVCTAVLSGPFPKFYQTGDDLAADLEAAMNNASCSGTSRANTYEVTYDEDDGDFHIDRDSGSRNFRIRWGQGPNNIRNALAETSTGTTSWTTGWTTDAPWTLLLREGSGGSGWIDFEFTETISGTNVTFYQVRAGRLWNGETLRVQADGTICGIDFGSAATRTSPPSFTVQVVNNNCGPDIAGRSVVFSFAGADFGGNNRSCRGFMPKAGIIPCDMQSPPEPTQIETIGPFIDPEFPFNPDGSAQNYTERTDGSWEVDTYPLDTQGGAKADGWTPIANSLIDIKGAAVGTCLDVTDSDGDGNMNELVSCPRRNFERFWFDGPDLTDPTTNPIWNSVPAADRPIRNHLDPKERTIVLFVTDGDDTCPKSRDSDCPGSPDCTSDPPSNQADMNGNALRAAYYAERLYERLEPTEPASSVITYVIGFGGAFTAGEPTRLNWIAWGGSGLGQNLPGQPDVPTTTAAGGGLRWSGTVSSLKALRADCRTCQDAFVAPDAATLAATLQAIIDQGASEGEFSAQQSITESIFEYVDLASNMTDTFDAWDPRARYLAIVPTRIISSFTLPGFNGQLKAYQNDGFGNAVLKWSAGDVLVQQVQSGMLGACPANLTTGALLGECSFDQLHGSASETTIASSGAAIKRRVYTTSRNGVYTFDSANLEAYGRGAWTPPERRVLWPPNTQVAPNNNNEGIFDAALGLPLDSTADAAGDLLTLQNEFGACVGNNRPGGCTSGTTLNQMKTARREARQMILAFMAGAQPAVDAGGPKRAAANNSGVSAGDILFTARSWVLADSELATPAVVTQPLPSEPIATPWLSEYQLFRDGDGTSRTDSDLMVRQGFGLRNPDGDATGTGIDTRGQLKPVMTVVYAPANDMLHAFRAGPCHSPSGPPDCFNGPAEDGGEELWGFVPFDQLGALRLRYINEPQGRDNHVYMLTRGVRFADVFVADDSPPMSVTVNGQSHDLNGVWRRILYVGRGIGGKYFTALDVTAPGTYTRTALTTAGPVPLWSRGNPDSQDGTAAGVDNGTAADRLAYAEMGETWSLPTIAYRDKTANTNPLYNTLRRPNGVDYVLFMGSGYGSVGEGSTFFTLDALSGDVIAAADVEAAATTLGLNRTTLPYANALVANAVGFNPAAFSLLETVHPAASAPTRVYIGDIHGRLWKFLAARPDVALPVADLGEDQPVGTAVSLLGMPPAPDTPVPFVFAVSGNDRRADGPFKMFGFRDDGTDTDVTIGSGVFANDVTTFLPMVSLHTRAYDQGDPEADCGYTEEAVFRGTIQPATAFECSNVTIGTCQDPLGRVFFAGTRLNLPNTVFAPPTPLACGLGDYPCRSSFDSIIYALGAKTGLAAYDLNASGDDAYRIYRDNRIAAIAMLADPDPTRGGSSFNPDESEMKAPPKPPPPPGVPPTSTSASANVIMVRQPGQPPPSVHYGSTVCQ